MTIVCIAGELGEGKTLSMTYLGIKQYTEKGKRIYTNYPLVGIPFELVKSLEQFDSMRDGVAIMDEFWFWIDSRSFKRKANLAIRDIIMKSRKRGFDIFYTTQRFGAIDIAVRQVTDFLVVPELLSWVHLPGFEEKVPLKCILKWYQLNMGEPATKRPMKVTKFNPLPILNTYDTLQEIDQLEMGEK